MGKISRKILTQNRSPAVIIKFPLYNKARNISLLHNQLFARGFTPGPKDATLAYYTPLNEKLKERSLKRMEYGVVPELPE